MVVSSYIDSCSFGSIVVNDEEYTSDLILADGSIITDWWREESHQLKPEDLSMVDWGKVKAVFIGTGFSSKMKLSQDLISMLEKRNIPFIAIRTPVAVDEYNRFAHANKVGIFHLTC